MILRAGLKLLGYFVVGYAVVDVVRWAVRDELEHVHDHQHGTEAAIESLNGRLVALEGGRSATEGDGSSVN